MLWVRAPGPEWPASPSGRETCRNSPPFSPCFQNVLRLVVDPALQADWAAMSSMADVDGLAAGAGASCGMPFLAEAAGLENRCAYWSDPTEESMCWWWWLWFY